MQHVEQLPVCRAGAVELQLIRRSFLLNQKIGLRTQGQSVGRGPSRDVAERGVTNELHCPTSVL